MSISGLGLYSQHNMDEAIVSQPAQQAKAAVPAGAVDQQSRDALAQASYQSTISTYGQAQNAMAYLRSTVQGMDRSAQSGNASSGFSGQQPNAGNSLAKATQAVQAFVNGYNANGSSGIRNSDALNGIGISSGAGGMLSLDAQVFQNALSSQPGKVAQVFSSIAESVAQQEASRPAVQPAPELPQSQTGAGQAQFASETSSAPGNPQPAQSVISQAVAPNPPSLAAQYSVVSQLG